ncbi:unnamed protein product [Prunus armeniaca]
MCGSAWETVAVGHWVPVQSPICHKRIGVLRFEIGYHLSLKRIFPIVRFLDLICSDYWIELKLTYVVPCVSRIVDRSPGYSKIANPRSVTTAPSLETSAQPASTTIAPALIDHVPVGPGGTTDTISVDGTGASGSQPAKKNTRGPCRQLKTAKVTRVTSSRISIGYNERHRVAPTAELHSSLAHDIGHVVRTYYPMQWKSWNVMPDEIKMETNENLEDLDDELLAYVNRLFAETYKQWKSDLHHHFEGFDDPQNKAQVNKGNRKKKTLITIPVPGPSHIGWMHGGGGGLNSQRSTSLVTFMFDLGMSWPSLFIRRWWRGVSWFFRSPPLPTSSRDSDRVCGSSTRY